MQLVFATNNAHKVSEVRAILAPTGITVITLEEAGIDVDPPETGDTFEANALQKAHYIHGITRGWVVADDSGIEVDALDGRPGVYSKRFSPEATTAANNALLLAQLGDRTDRTARFRCVLALVGPDREATVSGSCEGRIAFEPAGADGFGYDPLFLPDETPGRTMAELSSDEKNAISHRGRAFRRLPELLER
ncbi:MAG: RdgB/HAM1 family non-canonical purine NTP pyrophosphatase [Myxococcota bacterium]